MSRRVDRAVKESGRVCNAVCGTKEAKECIQKESVSNYQIFKTAYTNANWDKVIKKTLLRDPRLLSHRRPDVVHWSDGHTSDSDQDQSVYVCFVVVPTSYNISKHSFIRASVY